MKTLNKLVITAMMGAGVVAFSIGSASAAVVCSRDVCWHTKEHYDYPPDAHLTIHPEDWKWGPSEHYTWREHEGRGYWRDDRWMEW